jgi:peptide/nickel transport system substrate-binding protein
MNSGSGLSQQMAEMMQGYLAKIGIEMKVHEIEFNQMKAMLNDPNSDWQAAGLGQTNGGYPSGEDLFGAHSFANQGGYSDAEMDKVIAQSTDQPGLSGLYAYENYASAQQPVIFMETGITSMLVRNRIQGAQNFVDASFNYYPDALSCVAPGA